MPEQTTEFTVEKMARFLKEKKSLGQRLVLFLGQRTGPLFSNDALYEALKHCIMNNGDPSRFLKRDAPSNNDFQSLSANLQDIDDLSPLDRFHACYGILSKHFSVGGINALFIKSLLPLYYRWEDELLAELLKASFFETIITTNIDTLLEDVLWNMKQPEDYQVSRYGKDQIKEVELGEARCGQIIKIFGDLSYLIYKTAGNEFDLEADQELKKFLSAKLSEEVLMIGYDPTWDRPIEKAFRELGKVVWYVNEELPPQNTPLMRILSQRKGMYLVGTHGSYSSFLKSLSEHMNEEEFDTNTASTTVSPLSHTKDEARKRVFISYSHNDRKHLERLQKHLDGYLHVDSEQDLLDIWDDTKIVPGVDWKEEIRKALSSAKVAVLLLSADFFASKFIREHEIPVLLAAADAGEVRILCVLLAPCVYKRTQLQKYQFINSEPLIGTDSITQEATWERAADTIFDYLKS